jgi:hypothetical protein
VNVACTPWKALRHILGQSRSIRSRSLMAFCQTKSARPRASRRATTQNAARRSECSEHRSQKSEVKLTKERKVKTQTAAHSALCTRGGARHTLELSLIYSTSRPQAPYFTITFAANGSQCPSGAPLQTHRQHELRPTESPRSPRAAPSPTFRNVERRAESRDHPQAHGHGPTRRRFVRSAERNGC